MIRVARFELRRFLTDSMTWAGFIAFMVVLVVGAVDYWNALPPRPSGARLFGEAYLLGLSFAFHNSIAQDRGTRFDIFLASNFVRTSDLYFGKVFAAVVFLFAAALTAFAVSLFTSLGDLVYAAKYATLFWAASVLILPVVALAEIALTTRYPLPLILALFFAALAVYHRTGDLPRLLHVLGFDGQLSLPATSARSLIAIFLTSACYPLYRMRLGRARSTRL